MDSLIDPYLDDLRLQMKGKIPRRKQEEILAEARTHLEDEVMELTAQGMARQLSEKTAIERFGEAGQVNEWFLSAHRQPPILRAALWPIVILATFVLLGNRLPLFFLPGFISSKVLYLNLTLLLMIWACFRAKRITLPLTIPAVALYGIGLFVYFSALCVPRPGEHGEWIIRRSTADQHIMQARIDTKKAEVRLAVLAQGHEVFKPSVEPAVVPPEFKTARGYATPEYFQMQDYPVLSVFLNDVKTDGLMSSWSEARQFWIGQPTSPDPRTGRAEPHDIAEAGRQIWVNQRVIDELPGLLKTTWRDHVGLYARTAAMSLVLPLYFAVLGDFLGSFLRWAGRVRRARRRLPRSIVM